MTPEMTPMRIFCDAFDAGVARIAPADISFHAPIDLRSGWMRVRTTGLCRGRGQRRNRRNRIGLSMQRLFVGVTY